MKKFLFLGLLFSVGSRAELPSFQGLKDQGMNKYQRINEIESFLEKLSSELKVESEKKSEFSDEVLRARLGAIEASIESLTERLAKNDSAKVEFTTGEEKNEGKIEGVIDDVRKFKFELELVKENVKKIENIAFNVDGLKQDQMKNFVPEKVDTEDKSSGDPRIQNHSDSIAKLNKEFLEMKEILEKMKDIIFNLKD